MIPETFLFVNIFFLVSRPQYNSIIISVLYFGKFKFFLAYTGILLVLDCLLVVIVDSINLQACSRRSNFRLFPFSITQKANTVFFLSQNITIWMITMLEWYFLFSFQVRQRLNFMYWIDGRLELVALLIFNTLNQWFNSFRFSNFHWIIVCFRKLVTHLVKIVSPFYCF